MFENILLAVDGSEHALRAASMAGNLVRAMKAKQIRIVVAYDLIPPYIGDPFMQQAINARLDQSKAILDAAVKEVGQVDAELHTELLEGSPAEAIIEVAQARHCDLIVMGARGLGRIAAAVLGSTSQKVVAHAPCPVLIVR